MAKRFVRKGQIQKSFYKDVLVSICLFAVFFALFLVAIKTSEQSSFERQKEVLEQAVERGLLQCYVTEGRYPKSVNYLKEHYGLTYDEAQFRIDYISYGSNLRPEVTVVVLGGGQ